jgi:hypothetical protein
MLCQPCKDIYNPQNRCAPLILRAFHKRTKCIFGISQDPVQLQKVEADVSDFGEVKLQPLNRYARKIIAGKISHCHEVNH